MRLERHGDDVVDRHERPDQHHDGERQRRRLAQVSPQPVVPAPAERTALFPAKGLLWGILSRVIAIPLIAGISFELLRLGARYTDAPVMRAIMAPGLWLQKITTRPPDHSQIEVAIASFQEVLRAEAEEAPGAATPPTVTERTELS